MKKKIVKVFLAIICMGGLFYLYQSTPNTINDLTFDNIEALASGESNENFNCLGVGSIECKGYKYKYKITYNLRPQ